MTVEKVVLEFEHKAIAALIEFAAKNDIRYYLNGIYFEVKDGKSVVAATNGHALGAIYSSINTDATNVSLIVPRHAIEIAIKAGKVIGKSFPLSIEITGDRAVLLWNKNEGIVFAPIEAKFPDIERVIPKNVSGEISTINWGYLRAFEKASQILTGAKSWVPPKIGYNGNAGALITVPAFPNFTGVVMPIRA